MEILRVNDATASHARGIVIVIDVIRAFTVAGYAFAGGARGLWLVRTVEEAFALKKREEKTLLAGEIGGRLIPGFDLNNSPSHMRQADVQGYRIIQRTGAGTQAAVKASLSAQIILPASLTNARATANYARQLAADLQVPITLYPSFIQYLELPDSRNEDEICADYITALIRDDEARAETILRDGIAHLEHLDRFSEWKAGISPDLPLADIEAILAPNCFPFVMRGLAQKWNNITYISVECLQP